MVPFDTQSPFVTSGMRVGTPAMTSRGMKETEMARIVELIDMVIMNHTNGAVIEEVKTTVNDMMEHFPLY